jgi:hypothetical protein
MGWLSMLLATWSGQAPPVPAVDHPVFGPIRPPYRPKGRPWLWQNQVPLGQAHGAVCVSWLADSSGPSEAHIAFWHWLTESIDSLVEQAWPLLAAEFDDGSEQHTPADPWEMLTWTGAHLPADGGHASEWSLAFARRRLPEAIYSVTFREGLPAFVTAAARFRRWLAPRHRASAYAAPGRRLPVRSGQRRTTGRHTSGGYSAGHWDQVVRAARDQA